MRGESGLVARRLSLGSLSTGEDARTAFIFAWHRALASALVLVLARRADALRTPAWFERQCLLLGEGESGEER